MYDEIMAYLMFSKTTQPTLTNYNRQTIRHIMMLSQLAITVGIVKIPSRSPVIYNNRPIVI